MDETIESIVINIYDPNNVNYLKIIFKYENHREMEYYCRCSNMYQFHNENTPYYFFKKNIET